MLTALSRAVRDARDRDTRPIFIAKHGFDCNPQTVYRWEVLGVFDAPWIPRVMEAIDASPEVALVTMAEALGIEVDDAKILVELDLSPVYCGAVSKLLRRALGVDGPGLDSWIRRAARALDLD